MSVSKSLLGLELPSDPRWAEIAEENIGEILIDHAYCEQKAATSGISLIINFSEKQELVDTVTPMVAEEWAHFERVLAELRKRNIPLGRPRKDEYVVQISQMIRKGGNREVQLMDRLLNFALIEARSCERFKLLSQKLQDEGLRKFYYELMVSEAGHYRAFIDLAKVYMPEQVVMERWRWLLEQEAKIMANMKSAPDRLH